MKIHREVIPVNLFVVPVTPVKARKFMVALVVALCLYPSVCLSGAGQDLGDYLSHGGVRSWLAVPSEAEARALASLPSGVGIPAGQEQPTGGADPKDTTSGSWVPTGPANRQQLIAALSAENGRDRSTPGAAGEGVPQAQGAAPAGTGETTTYKVQPRYSYYWDTDENIVNRYGLALGAVRERWLLTLDGQYISAKDSLRNNDAVLVLMSGYAKLTGTLGLGGGLGGVTMNGTSTETSLIGHVKGDLNLLSGNVSLYVGREALPDTATLIGQNIRYSVVSLSVTQRPVERLSVTARYDYRDYSDHNFANDIQATLSMALSTQPLATAGYSFRYLNFERQSRGGYFDPDNFVSHQLFAVLTGESGRFFYNLQPFAGYQAYSRNGERQNEFYGGGLGSLGVRFSRKVALELNAEGGNYALGTASGFGYYLFGIRLDASL